MVMAELVQSIGILSVIFFGLGFLLMIIEVFVPGFGVSGILGIIFLIAGVIVTAKTLLEALILIIIILAILGVLTSILIRSVSKGRLPNKIILSTSISKDEGYIGTNDMQYFLDKVGTTLTVLRPAGTVDFDGVKLDVISEGDFIPKDTLVKVTKVEGRKIVVRQIRN
ncbi:membrane-bound serine protease (ClpP class) [Proteiniborus sp. DW1]|uniref:NfeD family protein n=1 Tax=Proteiniborus sp. DW1 TaxID=1889883 RepID=UPI00092DF9BE|nr:NfeD family protein [Proteiniborus sp. DW1]SCG83637.1 membrane-bound serine protease (ClpP class) [Proteiniborus sp. DW1]